MISVHWCSPGESRVEFVRNLDLSSDIMAIIAEVCAKHLVSYSELRSDRRSRYIAWPRQEVMYRAAKETTLSLPAIGRILGGRDHSTIQHGIRQHERRMKEANV